MRIAERFDGAYNIVFLNAMGDMVVPLLLQGLGDHPSIQGLILLKGIIGTNPFPPDDRGDVARMAEAWLRWAQEQANDETGTP